MMMNDNNNNNIHELRLRGHNYDDDDDMQVRLLPSPSMSCSSIVVGKPIHGIATLASPILAAVGLTQSKKGLSSLSSSSPLVAILTSDGLVHTRSPSFISIPLCTIEVGTRPNDFFTLQALPNRKVVAGSYSGQARLIAFREDTEQDLADRMMTLAIDAFGSNGFPRTELAKATGATFTATSYVGSEPTPHARNVLKQYLETCLGLDMTGDFGNGALYKQFLYQGFGCEIDDDFAEEEKNMANASMSPFAGSYLCATAMLCLACTRLSSPISSLANRAAKSCATKFGTITTIKQTGINEAAIILCEIIAKQLLKESESKRVIPPSGGLATGKNGIRMDMVEAASWLLRACGKHELSIKILQERMDNPAIRNKMFVEGATQEVFGEISYTKSLAGWSQSKYDSHLCLHLGDLWSSGDTNCQELVLSSSATKNLLEHNPSLGLKIFTSMLPQNEQQWSKIKTDSHFDVIQTEVIDMLKSINPRVPRSKDATITENDSDGNRVSSDSQLPLESGRALAVAYLECLIGISTGKPQSITLNISQEKEIEMHNELAFLLLEGVLLEQNNKDSELDTEQGKIYREKLRRLLGWHSSKVEPDDLMDVLPKSFLREKALLLGQLGRHEDALRIFYNNLKSLDLALEYCDARYEKQQVMARDNFGSKTNRSCVYLPLVRVALESDNDSERGTAAAVKVLSLRRGNIDRAAALRLLPKSVPVSALARSFLIPALIDTESQTRRLSITASLLRAKYTRLKHSLTEAQIKSQSILQNVPALQSLNLGDPVYTSNSFKARPLNVSSLHFPEVTITKHFFPRYVIIQATATAKHSMIVLRDVQLVVAESSDEALLPSINIPIKTLPPGMTSSAWCVLSASPQRLDGTAVLVCEIQYSVSPIDCASASPEHAYVEEIKDIEIRRAEFG